MKIHIKYHNTEIEKLKQLESGNWIDLRAAENVTLKKGEYRQVSLGISIKLPEGYEAHVAPRSSTFKNWGIILTNSVGVIDNSYCGTNDVWMVPVYALRDTEIKVNDRICQFRVTECMPKLEFEDRDALEENDRGGFGSTGTN